MSRFLFLVFTLISFLLTSCVSDPNGYLKRSGSKKLIGSKNIYYKKRMPIQNQKYIKKAKKNIIEDNLEEDEEEDDPYDQNPKLINKRLYMQMIEQEKAKNRQNHKKDRELRELELEEREKQISNKMIQTNQESQKIQKELHTELEQIKSMLNETKEQMASMSCLNKNKNQSVNDPLPDINQEKNSKIENHVEKTELKPSTNNKIDKNPAQKQPDKSLSGLVSNIYNKVNNKTNSSDKSVQTTQKSNNSAVQAPDSIQTQTQGEATSQGVNTK